MSWLTKDVGHEAHVIPLGDEVGHDLNQDCPCGPAVEFHARPLVIHHSLDDRPNTYTGMDG